MSPASPLCQAKPLSLTHIVQALSLEKRSRGSISETVFRDITNRAQDASQGMLLAALAGTRTHGAHFFSQAYEKGVRHVLTDVQGYQLLYRNFPDVTFLISTHPLPDFARACRLFYPCHPLFIGAVTGTNGKTSVVNFARQLLEKNTIAAASLGTLGLQATRMPSEKGLMLPIGHQKKECTTQAGLTTPDALSLCRRLSELSAQEVQNIFLEASSHGLAQHRLEGIDVHSAIWTNFSHDHLDYHKTWSAYFEAKARLFEERLVSGGSALFHESLWQNPHIPSGDLYRFLDNIKGRDIRVYSYGTKKVTIPKATPLKDLIPKSTIFKCPTSLLDGSFVVRAVSYRPWAGAPLGQAVSVEYFPVSPLEKKGFWEKEISFPNYFRCFSPLPGKIQVENVFAASFLAHQAGLSWDHIQAKIPHLQAIPGRLEYVASHANGAPVYMDYAHTPAALQTALKALRPLVSGNLHVIFGCGGERDHEKRPKMGGIASTYADAVIVTDDNPRNEDPDHIRKAILTACPQASEISNRGQAIAQGIDHLKAEDVLLIAGKGHESVQIIKSKALPFCDRQHIVAKIITNKNDREVRMNLCVWSALEIAQSLKNMKLKSFPNLEDAFWVSRGLSIDTRTLREGDLFFALKTPSGDGHRFIKEAFDKGAVAAFISDPEFSREGFAENQLILVNDVQRALEGLAVYARNRASQAVRIAVTGSVGKTSVKEGLAHILRSKYRVHANLKSFNNHLGVPLSLGHMPYTSEVGVFEIGTNHPGEISPLAALVKPHIALITPVGCGHIGNFASERAIAEEKASLFSHLQPGGTALIQCSTPWGPFMVEKAKEAGVQSILTIGWDKTYTIFPHKVRASVQGSSVDVMWDGEMQTYWIPRPGRHWVLNSLMLLAAAKISGVDFETAKEQLKRLPCVEGRGKIDRLIISERSFVLVDDTFNANPLSMQATLETLSWGGSEERGRVLAVLGDMGELGYYAPQAHLDLVPLIKKNNVARVFSIGVHMKCLYDALPSWMQAGHFENIKDLKESLLDEIQTGDWVVVKGSHFLGLHEIIKDLTALSEKTR